MIAGTLLTVDEATQWVLHAAQLPQEVADAFVNNMVTGYDFPELAARQVSCASGGAGSGPIVRLTLGEGFVSPLGGLYKVSCFGLVRQRWQRDANRGWRQGRTTVNI